MHSCLPQLFAKNSCILRADRVVRPYRDGFAVREKEGAMKKSHKILLALALLAAAAAVIVISNLPIAKTQEAVGELLRKKLDLPQDAVITCAGDYTADAYTLLWFIIQNQDMTLYRAVHRRMAQQAAIFWTLPETASDN